MGKVIRVTVTTVYEYTPDLNEAEYAGNGVTTIEQALELDKRDYDRQKVQMEDLSYNLPTTASLWEIVEDQT